MEEKYINDGNKLIAESLKVTPSNVEEIGELTLDKGLVNGYYRPYPLRGKELFNENFVKENPHVKFEFNLSCGRCDNCSGYECGGYVLTDMPIEMFNQYKNIDKTFGDPVYPRYDLSWDLFVPAFNKIQKMKQDKEFCDLILAYIRHNDHENSFKCLVNYINMVIYNKPIKSPLIEAAKGLEKHLKK